MEISLGRWALKSDKASAKRRKEDAMTQRSFLKITAAEAFNQADFMKQRMSIDWATFKIDT